jgi:sugar phosphate isomerase/epimerase
LETFNFDINKKCLTGKSDLAASIAQEVRKKFSKFGLILDLFHLLIQYEQIKIALKKRAMYMTHLNISNRVLRDKSLPAYGDQHPRFGFIGEENDVEQVRKFFSTLFELE